MRCGQCEYYDDSERSGSKGHCDYLGMYVYASDDADDCSHFKKAGSSGGCYMTTACCEYYGLPDDCRELTAMVGSLLGSTVALPCLTLLTPTLLSTLHRLILTGYRTQYCYS